MLNKKPVFFVTVKAVDIGLLVGVNGMFAYTDLSHKGQVELDVPVNHYMHPSENNLTVEVFPPEEGGEFEGSAYVNVELRVREMGNHEKSYEIAKINFDPKSKLEKNRSSYTLSSGRDFQDSDNGDVLVSEIESWESPEYRGSLVAKRKIKIPNALPEWAFFRSDDIPDYYDFDAVSEEKYQKDLEGLLVEYEKVHNAIKNNDIEGVISLFKERNKETDLAFYREPGETEDIITQSLKSSASDPNLDLLDIGPDYVALHPERNGKVVSLRRDSMKSPVVLNFKEGEGSVHYPMYFRKEDGKWILTR